MRRSSLMFVIAGLCLTTSIEAGCPSYSRGNLGFYNYSRVASMRCTIREIDSYGRLFVEDEADGRRHWVTLPESAKVLAGRRSRSQFDGRKTLSAADLEVGQRIRVSSFKKNGKILSVRVIRPSKRSSEPAGVVLADLAFQP